MLEVINLALPFFGLIFLGFGCGKFKAIPDSGLAWMDFFILYVALPALFYRIVAQTPLEQLANPRFIVGTMLATFCAFSLSFAIGMMIRRGQVAESTIAGNADDRHVAGKDPATASRAFSLTCGCRRDIG